MGSGMGSLKEIIENLCCGYFYVHEKYSVKNGVFGYVAK